MSDASDAKSAVVSWIGMFKGLEKAVAVLEALEGADAALALKKSELSKAETEFERLSGKRATLDADLAAKREEMARELSRFKEDLRQRQEAASEEFRRDMLILASQKSALESAVESARAELAEVSTALSGAKAELSAIRAEVAALKKKFS